jgi:hypothetical protein
VLPYIPHLLPAVSVCHRHNLAEARYPTGIRGLFRPALCSHNAEISSDLEISLPTETESSMIIRFRCRIAGVGAVIAADTQAIHCFINIKLVRDNGIATTPAHRTVELADKHGRTAQR